MLTLTRFTISFSLPYLLNDDYAGLHSKVGFIFGAMAFFSLIFAFFCVPEVKGKQSYDNRSTCTNTTSQDDLSKTLTDYSRWVYHCVTLERFSLTHNKSWRIRWRLRVTTRTLSLQHILRQEAVKITCERLANEIGWMKLVYQVTSTAT